MNVVPLFSQFLCDHFVRCLCRIALLKNWVWSYDTTRVSMKSFLSANTSAYCSFNLSFTGVVFGNIIWIQEYFLSFTFTTIKLLPENIMREMLNVEGTNTFGWMLYVDQCTSIGFTKKSEYHHIHISLDVISCYVYMKNDCMLALQ